MNSSFCVKRACGLQPSLPFSAKMMVSPPGLQVIADMNGDVYLFFTKDAGPQSALRGFIDLTDALMSPGSADPGARGNRAAAATQASAAAPLFTTGLSGAADRRR